MCDASKQPLASIAALTLYIPAEHGDRNVLADYFSVKQSAFQVWTR